MPNEFTNLLPRERRNALSRDYAMRLSVIVVWFVTGLTFAAGVLLIPTDVFLSASTGAKEARLTSINAAFSSADEAALTARLTTLNHNAATLTTLAGQPSPSGTIRALLALPHPNIALSGFVYTPAIGKNLGTLAVSGTAFSRDALRSYQLALQGAPFVTLADLPVSAYAKDTDIAFTITVTLAP